VCIDYRRRVSYSSIYVDSGEDMRGDGFGQLPQRETGKQ
jgi:hypothetical protein